MKLNPEQELFIEKWGSMGVLWGINRSMARIHALALLSEAPLDLDEISETLNISRGNASMSIRELKNWGVVQKVQLSGDRRDFYAAEPDSWRMFFRIVVERKKREFDPAMTSLKELMDLNAETLSPTVKERLREIDGILETFDVFLEKFLASETRSRTFLGFIKNFIA